MPRIYSNLFTVHGGPSEISRNCAYIADCFPVTTDAFKDAYNTFCYHNLQTFAYNGLMTLRERTSFLNIRKYISYNAGRLFRVLISVTLNGQLASDS